MDIIGCSVTLDQFTSYLLDCNQVSYTIDLHNNRITIGLHNTCGGVNIVYENSTFNPVCVGNLNEFLRIMYATKTVCLNIIPFKQVDDALVSSLSQGLAHQAEEITKVFATSELYPRLLAYIRDALNQNPHW
jgi:hypothetical protein